MPDRPPASQTPPRPLAVVGARLVDPASRYDGPGCLLVRDGQIAEAVQSPAIESLSPDFELIEASGAMLAPGLVDLRVKTGEPGDEPKETLKSAERFSSPAAWTASAITPSRTNRQPGPS